MSGKTGRPRKPSHLKAIQGTYRKDRAAANEPRPEVAIPECPPWLGPVAQEEWDRVSKQLEVIGLISHIDRAALAGYCEAFQLWHDARKALDEAGSLIQETPNGYQQQRPEVGIINTALKTMRAFMTEFGMTPAARSRVDAMKPQAEEDDEWQRLQAL